MSIEISEKLFKEVVDCKMIEIKNENRNILSCFDKDDSDDVIELSKKYDLELEELIYLYLNESDKWIKMFDDNAAYNEFGRINHGTLNELAGTDLKHCDYKVSNFKGVNINNHTYYIKKDIDLFLVFISNLSTNKYNDKLIELMNHVIENESDLTYEKLAWLKKQDRNIFR